MYIVTKLKANKDKDGNITKPCSTCGEVKLLECFAKDKRSYDGVTTRCKVCGKKYAKNWYKNNTEKQKKNAVEYRKKHPGSHRESHLKRVYGITIKQYNKMFLKQNGCCAICGVHQSELSKRLFVDHCHSSNKVRALLCHSCNSALGLLKEDKEILVKMIEYIGNFREV